MAMPPKEELPEFLPILPEKIIFQLLILDAAQVLSVIICGALVSKAEIDGFDISPGMLDIAPGKKISIKAFTWRILLPPCGRI